VTGCQKINKVHQNTFKIEPSGLLQAENLDAKHGLGKD